jgi:hypothetical protein
MTKIQYTTSPGVPPQSMEEEFLSHRRQRIQGFREGVV